MRKCAHTDKVNARLGISTDVLEHNATTGLSRNPLVGLAFSSLTNAFYGTLHFFHCHVVEQDGFGSMRQRLFQLLRGAHLYLHPLAALALLERALECGR